MASPSASEGFVACPNRTYGFGTEHTWAPSAAEQSGARACLGDDELSLTIARTNVGCFRMAVLRAPDIVSLAIRRYGHWEIDGVRAWTYRSCSLPGTL